MAKMFYTVEEATRKLGADAVQLTGLVREGKLREFRDGDTVNYKVSDVDGLVGSVSFESSGDSASASATGEIVLEPADDSGIELVPSQSDVISLDDSDLAATKSGTSALSMSNSDSVVPSVGVDVFEDDELGEDVDPLAQTAIEDLAGLGIDAAGSGSGILDLTRESDDTSLGKDLLDELYTDDSESSGTGALEMGDATRAGLESDISDEPEPQESDKFEPQLEDTTSVASGPRGISREVIEFAPDSVSTALTALMVVSIAVLWVCGLAAASLVRGIKPGLLDVIYQNLWIFALGSVGVGVLAAGITYVLAKRRA